jgi:SOS response regulatory protein OraA/RecX
MPSTSEDDRGAISDQDLRNIYLKMIDYLSQADMAEQRLVDRIVRLKKRYPTTRKYDRYTAENARAVLPLLRQEGYLNEERYARRLFDFLRDKRDGLPAIRRKMLSRRIQRQLVEKILSEFESAEIGQDLERITAAARARLSALRKKFGAHPQKKYQIRSKLYAWLALRGFSTHEIASISKEIGL